jgi:hypothetical protein
VGLSLALVVIRLVCHQVQAVRLWICPLQAVLLVVCLVRLCLR